VLLNKIPLQDSRGQYLYDDNVFFYICDNGIVFLVLTDSTFKARSAFLFLEDMKDRWRASFAAVEATALAFSLDEAFRPTLRSRMEFYSNSENSLDSIAVVQSKIDDTKQVMVQNIEKVLERGEKIELLVTKTDKLASESARFNRSAKTLKRELWCRAFRSKLICLFVVLVCVGAGVAAFCGLSLDHCSSSSKHT
jgi:vesicle-associated membrane protein 7